MTKKNKIKVIAEMIHYNLSWVCDMDDVDSSYVAGAIDSAGHMAACAICQWFDIEGGVPTSDTVDMLKLGEFAGRDELEKLIAEYISDLKN